MKISYPCSGWLAPGTRVQWERSDQGRDLVIPWRGVWQAPGAGECVNVGSDRPFPNGFGPAYPWVRIDTGRFAGHTFYLGHCTALVRAGQRFTFGHPIARADQGHDFNGTLGGWTELGQVQADGTLGPFSATGHWYDHLLREDLVIEVPDPVLQFGSRGPHVIAMTILLVQCGWLTERSEVFDTRVHGGVVAFRKHHHLPSIHGDEGVVDAHTQVVLAHAAEWCRDHHKKENV